jgi:hypothetical protein
MATCFSEIFLWRTPPPSTGPKAPDTGVAEDLGQIVNMETIGSMAPNMAAKKLE